MNIFWIQQTNLIQSFKEQRFRVGFLSQSICFLSGFVQVGAQRDKGSCCEQRRLYFGFGNEVSEKIF
ncbi:hypothetical protein EGQ50_00450 [Coxiella endosymbiont of Amblyomma sculptum]|nr:hypothetical protein EGQ50_00450 [Coxiella endosymbiont of Amblyomma sculptum]